MHVFLSPHYDDAALSCGGLIHQLAQRGEKALIITVMGGDPPDPPPDTSIVRDLHQRWQAGYNPVEARRREDACAARVLSAQADFFPFADCVYRLNLHGIALYPTEESLWGEVSSEDAAVETHLNHFFRAFEGMLYCPLGVGNHVDHKLVRNWGLAQLPKHPSIRFYAEYPYTARNPQALDEALNAIAAISPKLTLSPEHIELNEVDVAAKIRAIACYTSQISTFWKDLDDMEQATRAAMKAVGRGVYTERYWRIIE